MFTNSILAVSGALLSVVAAVPMAGEHGHRHQHHVREYVWETKVQEVVVTVPVTKTVWIEPGETPPTAKPYGGESASTSTTAPAAPAYTPPKSSSSAPAAPAYTPKSSSSSVAPVAPAYTPPSSTSVYVAPTPSTTSVYVAPTPSTTAPAAPAYTAPSSSAPAAPAYTSASSGGATGGGSGLSSGLGKSGTSYTGDLTWYDVGMGACGWTNTQDEPIVAISEKIFDSYNTGNPNNNPLCGKYVTITGKDGSPYKAKIVDRCPGCAEADLDLSQAFFNKCTENGDGRVSGMKWTFD